MNIYPNIDVEKTFNQLVREYGSAVVLSDMLPPKELDFPNADYIFHSEKIVVELKCLTEDNSKDENKKGKSARIVDHYFDTGKIKSKIINDETWLGLPLKLQNSLTDVYATSVHDRIKKADDQLAATKKQLGLESYSGLLILANDGLKSLPPAAVQIAALRYIDANRPHIDWMLYVTVNLLAEIEGMPNAMRFWLPTVITKPQKISDLFFRQLFFKFSGLVDRQIGMPTRLVEIQDQDEFARKFWKSHNIE